MPRSVSTTPRGCPRPWSRRPRKSVAIARKFNDEVARPLALELDRKTHEDPELLPLGLVKKANEWGFYTMWVPKIFGGKGYNMPSHVVFRRGGRISLPW